MFTRVLSYMLAAACVAVLAPARLAAITYGFADSQNVFTNVGAFVVIAPSGRIFPICSGTLIAPAVFLTATHCTAFFTQDLAPHGYLAAVTFDNTIPFGDLTSRKTKLILAVEVVSNPGYNQAQSDSGDIAVLLLPNRSTQGITPAALPTADLLDRLAAQNGLKGTIFTAVGYGVQNRVVGGGVPYFQDINPVPRMYSFSSFDSLNGGYIRLSQNYATGDGGTCYGDSGGPNFMTVNGTRVLAAITITGDSVCRATNVDYRLDTQSARAFLAPFVTLP